MSIPELYEELREHIDQGCESMTHKDAVLELKFVFSEYDRLTAAKGELPVDSEGRMTDEALDYLAGQLPLVKSWVQSVEDELLRRLETGSVFNNVRLAPKRATRAWFDEDQAKATLLTLLPLDQAAPRCVLSPAQAEKAVGKSTFAKILDPHVTRQSSGTTLKFNN